MRAITAAMIMLAAGLSPIQAEQSGTGLSIRVTRPFTLARRSRSPGSRRSA
jgi:hypothetical protein